MSIIWHSTLKTNKSSPVPVGVPVENIQLFVKHTLDCEVLFFPPELPGKLVQCYQILGKLLSNI